MPRAARDDDDVPLSYSCCSIIFVIGVFVCVGVSRRDDDRPGSGQITGFRRKDEG